MTDTVLAVFEFIKNEQPDSFQCGKSVYNELIMSHFCRPLGSDRIEHGFSFSFCNIPFAFNSLLCDDEIVRGHVDFMTREAILDLVVAKKRKEMMLSFLEAAPRFLIPVSSAGAEVSA
jgi:hypothetical protein